jgi:hypothetical protein
MNEELVFYPYEVKIADTEELFIFVEPNSYLKEAVDDKSKCWEFEINATYDEEKGEPDLIITLKKGNVRIDIVLPYGESWEALAEKGIISVVLLSYLDYENRKFDDSITLTLQLDDFSKGFSAGAMELWEAISEEKE